MSMTEKIAEFVKAADEMSVAYWKANEFTFSPPPTHCVEIGEKWAKVFKVEHNHDGDAGRRGSVYAFIVLRDGETKTLGKLKAGDIHKPASYKAPARTARGNIFDADYSEAMTATSVRYLRG